MGQFGEQRKLPSSTIVNPNEGFEIAKAITLRSGKEIGTNPKTSKQSRKEDTVASRRRGGRQGHDKEGTNLLAAF